MSAPDDETRSALGHHNYVESAVNSPARAVPQACSAKKADRCFMPRRRPSRSCSTVGVGSTLACRARSVAPKYESARAITSAPSEQAHSSVGLPVEAARGSSLGGAVTRTVTNRAFADGARAVTLQASAMGAPIYVRMGYESLHGHSTFVRFAPIAAPSN